MSSTPSGRSAPLPRILGVIPARLNSTRLPRKVLRELCGRPLLAWVVEAALRCPQLNEVLIACDSEPVAQLCTDRGWPYLMTSPDLPSGSDRLFAVARQIPADIYVNIQADEPLLQPTHIEALLAPFARPGVSVTTLKVPCPQASIHDPNVVKVVTASDGRALYFSRATIPHLRDQNFEVRDSHSVQYWKHLGLYAYRNEALARFASLPPSPLEQIERLEQLRLLENGLAIHVAESPSDTIGVDTEEDLLRVEALLESRSSTASF
jgi:3-deoxy-manno-octulosonate cytidylyltransferase (CMP-KDO synthetase)